MYPFTSMNCAPKTLTHQLPVKEYIEFSGFNTLKHGLYLLERNAPAPSSKRIEESAPFSHGNYDFSMMMGERFFHNRTLSYSFLYLGDIYNDRKGFEIMLKHALMPSGISKLIDSHDMGKYWKGKCVSVEIEDDAENSRLIAYLEFDCYPFLFSQHPVFDDIWDTFHFVMDIAQNLEFDLKTGDEFVVYNDGSRVAFPKIISNKNLSMLKDGVRYSINQGEQNYEIPLYQGENKFVSEDSGKVKFNFFKEVMG